MYDKPDNSPDTRVARLAAEQWSVLSAKELRGCGLSREMIATRVRRGYLHRLHRGVYTVAPGNVSVEGRFLAAVKACGGGAVLSHFSAAALWEMVEWDERKPEVTLCDTTPRTHPGIVAHRTVALDPRDQRRCRGIPVTAPARTAIDLASHLSLLAARRAIRQALSNRLLAVRDLVEIVERQSGRPGAGALRRIIADAPVPTRSVLEDVVLDVIRAAGLEAPEVNLP